MSKKDRKTDVERNVIFRLTVLLELYRHRSHECPLIFIQTHMRVSLPHEFEDDALDAELNYLLDKKFIMFRYSDLGATKLFRITADGVDLIEQEYTKFLD